MNLLSIPGDKIVFTGENGYEFEQEKTRGILRIGEVYTVKSLDVGAWRSSVTLEEVPNMKFNSVMFRDA